MSWYDIEANGELRFPSQIVPNCGTVFDVGVRTDDYLIRLNDGCTFHLFEPITRHFEILKSKIAEHRNVVANQCDLGAKQETLFIYSASESIARRENSGTESAPVRVIRMDDYCRQNGVERIDFFRRLLRMHNKTGTGSRQSRALNRY